MFIITVMSIYVGSVWDVHILDGCPYPKWVSITPMNFRMADKYSTRVDVLHESYTDVMFQVEVAQQSKTMCTWQRPSQHS